MYILYLYIEKSVFLYKGTFKLFWVQLPWQYESNPTKNPPRKHDETSRDHICPFRRLLGVFSDRMKNGVPRRDPVGHGSQKDSNRMTYPT